MTTAPFTRPTLEPAAPAWIVRPIPRSRDIEIVFVGHANRAELDDQIERLARWPWHLDDGGHVTVLADSHADPIGVRISRPLWTPAEIRDQAAALFGDLVSQAFDLRESRFFTKVSR